MHDSRVNVGKPTSSNADHILRDVDGVNLRPGSGLGNNVRSDTGAACVVEDFGIRCQRLYVCDGGDGMLRAFTGSSTRGGLVLFCGLQR